MSISDKDDRVYAVKKVLASNLANVGSDRNSSEGNDEIELLDLAEELVEKLADLLDLQDK